MSASLYSIPYYCTYIKHMRVGMFEIADFLFLARRRNDTSYPRSDWLLLLLLDNLIGRDNGLCPGQPISSRAWAREAVANLVNVKIAKSPHRKDGEGSVKAERTGWTVKGFFPGSRPTTFKGNSATV